MLPKRCSSSWSRDFDSGGMPVSMAVRKGVVASVRLKPSVSFCGAPVLVARPALCCTAALDLHGGGSTR